MSFLEKFRKLKPWYTQARTPYHHFTIVAPVVIKEYINKLKASPGKAHVDINLWALDFDEAIEMVRAAAKTHGFIIDGKIKIYCTDPVKPPKEKPYIYSTTFTY